MKKLLLLVVSAVFCVFASAQQMPSLPLDPGVRYGKLDNGLTYYIRHNEEPKGLVNFYIAQKVGSVQEEENQRGLAHFLEHMCFNGSVNYPGDGELINFCESIGVKFGRNLNAYTSTDETVYNIDAIPVTEENIDACMLILHDWADGLLLEPAEIDKERGVIHEEWRMRSSASQRILERRLPEIYPGSRYGERMPIGLMSVIDNFSPEFLRAYYEKWYRPDLQGVVIVGDIDVDQIEAKIKAVFGPIEMPEDAAEYVDYPVPSNEHAIYVIDSDKEQTQPIIYAMFKTDPLPKELRNTPFYFVQDYIVTSMCDALNTRLEELSQKPECPFLAAQVGYDNFLIAKTMDALMVLIVPKPGQDEAAVTAAMTELERARRFGITASELSRANEEMLSHIERQYDNREKQRSSYYVNKYVRHFLDGTAVPGLELEYQLAQAYIPQIPAQAVNQTLAELTASIDKDFVFLAMYPQTEGVAVPTPEQMKAAVEAARAAEIEAYVDNVKDEPLIAKLPKKGKIKSEKPAAFGYTQLVLSNGANVFYKKTDFSDTEVFMSARSNGGLSLISEKDIVNAQLVDQVINAQGMGAFTATELRKALSGKQVSINIGLNQIGESISGSSTPKDLKTLFELTYLCFQEPANDPDSYNSTIAGLKMQLENADKTPMSALQDTLTKTLYGNNPRTNRLKIGDLDKADYKTIKKIYKERFASAGDFDFFFVGNFDEQELKDYVCQYIAPLKKAKKREAYVDWKLYINEGVNTNRFTRAMETPQAYIVQIWSGEQEYSLKEAAVVDALGTILSNRYLKSIREDGGMAYSVSTNGMAEYGLRDEYIFQTVCPFTPALCDSVLFLMQKGIEDIAAEGVTEEELDNYRKFEEKSYTENQRRNGYWQGLITTYVMWGKDNQTGYMDAVNSVSSDDIKTFVNDVLLKQNNCSTVIMLPEDFTE